MTETRAGTHRIKGLLPPEAQVAHKTGTSGTEHGITSATNDIGLIQLPTGSTSPWRCSFLIQLQRKMCAKL